MYSPNRKILQIYRYFIYLKGETTDFWEIQSLNDVDLFGFQYILTSK